MNNSGSLFINRIYEYIRLDNPCQCQKNVKAFLNKNGKILIKTQIKIIQLFKKYGAYFRGNINLIPNYKRLLKVKDAAQLRKIPMRNESIYNIIQYISIIHAQGSFENSNLDVLALENWMVV